MRAFIGTVVAFSLAQVLQIGWIVSDSFLSTGEEAAIASGGSGKDGKEGKDNNKNGRHLSDRQLRTYANSEDTDGETNEASTVSALKIPELDVPGKYDAFNTEAVKCRRDLQEYQNGRIKFWMEKPWFPLMEWIWELEDDATGHTYYQGLLHILLCGQGECTAKRAKEMDDWEWYWLDQHDEPHKMVYSFIYADMERDPRIYFRLDPPKDSKEKLVPHTLVAEHNKSPKPQIYDLRPYLKCSQIEKKNPPPKKVKIGACITSFWDKHFLMPEWIAYHRMLGIEHFWFFVQEDFDNIKGTMPRHEEDITYIPYNYRWKDHKEHGREGMIQNMEGYSSNGDNWFQHMANNQCLYLAKQYGLDWIITPDVDETIAIHDPTVKHFQKWAKRSPLKQFLDEHELTPEPAYCPEKRKEDLRAFNVAHGKHPDAGIAQLEEKERAMAAKELEEENEEDDEEEEEDEDKELTPREKRRFRMRKNNEPKELSAREKKRYRKLNKGDKEEEPRDPIAQICLSGASYGRHPEYDADTRFKLSLDFVYRKDKKLGSGECDFKGIGAGGRRKCFYNPNLLWDISIYGADDVKKSLTSHADVVDAELFHFVNPMDGVAESTNPAELKAYPGLRDMYREKVWDEMKRLMWVFPRYALDEESDAIA